MNAYDIRRLALVLAKQAEIEGMKVENLVRETNKEAPAYSCECFNNASSDLLNLAYANDEQL